MEPRPAGYGGLCAVVYVKYLYTSGGVRLKVWVVVAVAYGTREHRLVCMKVTE